jgi:hypothetical protein
MTTHLDRNMIPNTTTYDTAYDVSKTSNERTKDGSEHDHAIFIQGVPKVPHTFVFAISLKSVGAQSNFLCHFKEEIWGIFES